MLQEGKLLAARRKIENIEWLLGESAKLMTMASDIGEIDMTTIGRAFHWMDKQQTLRDLFSITRPFGGIAIIGDNGPRDDPPDNTWKTIINKTVRSWLGENRKAGTKGIYIHSGERFETVLGESQFHNLESVKFMTTRIWTIDQIIGYLYSTSSSSIPVLQDKKEPFEKDLRSRLLSFSPDGEFIEEVKTEVLMMWK